MRPIPRRARPIRATTVASSAGLPSGAAQPGVVDRVDAGRVRGVDGCSRQRVDDHLQAGAMRREDRRAQHGRRVLQAVGIALGGHDAAGRHDLDGVRSRFGARPDRGQHLRLGVGLAAPPVAVAAGRGDRRAGGQDPGTGSAGSAGGDRVADPEDLERRAAVADGGDPRGEGSACVRGGALDEPPRIPVGLEGLARRGVVRQRGQFQMDVAVDQPGQDRRALVRAPRRGPAVEGTPPVRRPRSRRRR